MSVMTPQGTGTSAKRVTIMGLGRFGGGTGAARWWLDQGARVLVTDLRTGDELGDAVAPLEALSAGNRLEWRLGEHRTDDFCNTDLVIANPAVPMPWDNPYLRAAWDAGVHVTTEITLLIEQLDRDRVIGITGSAGKSTTAAMVHHVLTSCNVESVLGGNIGGSLLPMLQEARDAEAVVLELSSAMLWWLGATEDAPPGTPLWSPRVALTTNIEPNHLDWHGNEPHYRACKAGLVRHQVDGDMHICGDPGGDAIQLRLPGTHNQANARMAAAAAMALTSIDLEAATSCLGTFTGLPHRLQQVHEHEGCIYYNDSKSTTPAATLLALEAMPDGSGVHLIAGGHDKGIALDAIARASTGLAGLYTIGATGPGLADAASQEGARAVHDCTTLEQAVASASSRMEAGDILLLSPGCASWDQFEHFQQRGDRFTELARAITQRPSRR
jgi:UDP-N-acetylmuramoylalanine--D-glutamate ligase